MRKQRSRPEMLQPARAEDVIRILGSADQAMAAAILKLRPTVCDLEAASLWMMDDDDLVPSEVLPRSSVLARIVALLRPSDAPGRTLH